MSMSVGTATLSFDSHDDPVFGGSGLASAFMVKLQPLRIPKATVTYVRAQTGSVGTAMTTALAAMIAGLEDECEALADATVNYLTTQTLVSVTMPAHSVSATLPAGSVGLSGGIS